MSQLRKTTYDIHLAIIRINRNRKVVKTLSKFLEPGIYRNNVSFDIIHRLGEPRNLDMHTYSSHRHLSFIANQIIRLINLFAVYRVRNGKKEFEGTVLIITSSQSEYKLFDFDRNQVLTVFSSLDKMKKLANNKNAFIESFNVPKTLVFNEMESLVVEELIQHHPFLANNAFESLCQCLCKQLEKQTYHLLSESEYKEKINSFSGRFGYSPLLNNNLGRIVTLTHGDLWSSNVIYGGRDYFLTDYERVGERYFLFDFFCYMFTEWQLNSNSIIVDDYYAGHYDEFLKMMFKVVGVDFDVNQRQVYLLAFLVSIFFERWKLHFDNDDIIKLFINTYITKY